MAIVFMDWSETGALGPYSFLGSGIGVSQSNVAGPWSDYAISFTTANTQIRYLLPSTYTTLYGQIRFYINSGDYTNLDEMITFYSPNLVANCGIGTDALGRIAAFRGTSATQLAVGTTALTPQVWHYMQFKVVIASTSGAGGTDGELIIKVDEVTEVNYTAGATRNDSGTNGEKIGTVAYERGTWADMWIDDMILNDTSDTDNVSYPDHLGVEALLPNSVGDNASLTPKGGLSVSRFYFTNPNVSTDRATVSPTPSTLWDKTAGFSTTATGGIPARGILTPFRRETALTTGMDSGEGWTSGDDVLLVQLVSPPLAAQTISSGGTGTFKCYAIAREQSATSDMASQITVRVVSEDGATQRAVLYGGQTETADPPTSEWSITATNRGFPRAGLLPASLSEYTCVEGDRIVVELGFRVFNTDGTPGTANYVMVGDPASGSDLPENETDIDTAKVPWFEFSSPITLSTRVNWEYVDEAVANDGIDYVYDSLADEYDVYNLQTTRWTSVAGAMLVLKAQSSDAGVAKIAHMLKIDTDGNNSADELDTGSDIVLSTTWTQYGKIYNRQPDNAAATSWSAAKINALQIGAKVR